MNRSRVVIASHHSLCARALSEFCKSFSSPLSANHVIETVVLKSASDLFELLDNLKFHEALNTMVIYDSSSDHCRLWDVAGIGIGARGIGVQLLLQYPEIYFVFVGAEGQHLTPEMCAHHIVSLNDLSRLIELINLHASGVRFLFDPTGIRNALKIQLTEVDDTSKNGYLELWESRKKHVACVVEDELTFAHFNAYSSYRAGFRVYVATSGSELERLLPLSEPRKNDSLPQAFHTVITDWDLRFPDFVPSENMPELNIQGRLSPIRGRVIVVTSLKNRVIETWIEQTRDLRVREIVEGEETIAKVAADRCIPKPYPGIFHLVDILREGMEATNGARPRREPERHTAPYGSSVISTNLLMRAKLMADSSSRDHRLHLHSSLLTGEAKEILGGLSPTTFVEALSDQNANEIRAESCYLGLLSRIDPRGRLTEFEEEVSLGVLTEAREREKIKTKNDSIIQQFTAFRRIYGEYEEVAAAEVCLQKIAKFQLRRLWQLGGLANRCTYLGLWYSDLVTKSGTSVARLLVADVVIICTFFVIFGSLLTFHPCNAAPYTLWLSFGHSALTFMELGPGLGEYEEFVKCANQTSTHWVAGWVFLYRILLFLEISLAYINLGLLIAILYRRVIRRAP